MEKFYFKYPWVLAKLKSEHECGITINILFKWKLEARKY